MGFHPEWCLGSSMKNLLNQAACAIKLRLVRRRAAVAIMVALSAPVLLGMAGLVTDVTYWYGSRQAMQLAADAGAMAAARSGQANQATLQTIAVNAANMATDNRYGFNTNNLSVTLTNGGASFKTPSGTQSIPSSTSSASAFSTVTVSATTPAPVFFSGILGVRQSALGASASSTLRKNILPPTNSTLYVPGDNSGPNFHVGGANFVPSSDLGVQLTESNLSGGNSGYIATGASYVTNNNNNINTSNTSQLPSQDAPPCAQLLAQQGGLVDQYGNPTGDSSSYTTNGITSALWTNPTTQQQVEVYFGSGSSVSVDNYGNLTPTWQPVIVSPTTSVDANLNCSANASNSPSQTCDIPAAAYCGGLQVDPGSTIVFTDPNSYGKSILVIDGNAIMPDSSAQNYVTYASVDPQYGFYFGGSQVGGLLNTSLTAIYPGEIQQGVIQSTTTESQTYYNPPGTIYGYNRYGNPIYTESFNYVDQVCPYGVLPVGFSQNQNAACFGPVQTTANGVTNTTTLGAPGQSPTAGTSTGAYKFSIGQGEYATVVDTYVTTVTFQNGLPIYSGVTETTYFCLNSKTCSDTHYSKKLSISSSGYINPNNPNNAPPTQAQLACSSTSSNSLYSSSTPANEGFSSATTYASQSDTINVCGSGPQLQAVTINGEIVASAPSTSTNLWMSD
jgi:Flp pilus assembly protein TadG